MSTGSYDTDCNPSMLDTEQKLADQHAGETRRVGDHAMDRGYTSIFREHLFAGKVVVITGGGSGIGRCTAHELASLGAVVALIGRTPEKLDTVAVEVTDDGGVATTYPCDIRDEDKVKAAIAEFWMPMAA